MKSLKKVNPPFRISKLFYNNYIIPEGKDLTINRGGTSSGKTYTLCQVLILTAEQNPNSVITVVGQDIPNLKKGSIRDMLTIVNGSQWCKERIKVYNKSERIFYFQNGSVIEFNSYDDEQDAKNGKRDFAFFNEVNGISYEIFEAIYVRTRLHTWVDFNPSSEFWLKEKDFEHRSNVRTLKSTFNHNPFLDQKTINKILSYEVTPANIENRTADEYRWKVYGLGEYAAREGVIFKRWQRGKFPEDIDFGYGVDWGVEDPFAFIKVAIDHSKRKVYLKQITYQSGLSSSAILKEVKNEATKENLIVCDNVQKVSIMDLRESNYNAIPCFKPRISERIRWALDYLIIVDDSPNIEDELNNYEWANKKSEQPVDKFNHAMDAWMYYFVWWRMNVMPDII